MAKAENKNPSLNDKGLDHNLKQNENPSASLPQDATKDLEGPPEEQTAAVVQEAAPAAEAGTPDKGVVYFFAPASKYQISGPKKEIRDQVGNIIQPEGVIEFRENMLATNDPELIAFLRTTRSFQDGHIKECADMQEVNVLRSVRAGLKGDRTLYSEVQETAVYVPKGLGQSVQVPQGIKVIEFDPGQLMAEHAKLALQQE